MCRRDAINTGKSAARIASVIAVAVASLLLFYNLDDARFISPDEYRTLFFSKFRNPFLTLAYRPFLKVLGDSQSNAIAISASFGLLAVIATWVVSTKVFTDRAGFFAVVLLLANGLFLLYARTGEPCALLSLLCLSALYFVVRAVQTKHWHLSISICALSLTLAFFTYIPAYAFVVGIVVALSVEDLRSRRGLRRPMFLCASGILSALCFVLVYQLYELGRVDFAAYISAVLKFDDLTAIFTTDMVTSVSESFAEILRRSNVIYAIIIISAVFFWIMRLGKESDPAKRVVASSALIALVIYSCLGLAGKHTFYPRHLVHLIPLLCILVAGALELVAKRLGSLPVLLGLMLASGLSTTAISEIVSSTFKIHPVLEFLDANQIPLHSVATAVDLRRDAGPRLTSDVPAKLVGYPYGHLLIDWEKLNNLRATKGVKYLITSGIGTSATVGLNEERLSSTPPLFTMPHPYRVFGHPYYPRPSDGPYGDFRIYELNSLFTPE